MGRYNVHSARITNEASNGWQEGLLVTGVTGVPVVVVLAVEPAMSTANTAVLIAGAVAGALLSVAALLFYFHWLTAPSRRHGWTTTMAVVLAAHVLVTSSHHLADSLSSGQAIGSGGRALDAVTLAVLMGLMALGRRAVVNLAPLLVGVAIAIAMASLHVVAHVFSPLGAPTVPVGVASTVVLVGHLIVAWLVLRDHTLNAWVRQRLALTIALVGLSNIAGSSASQGTAIDLAAAAAQLCAAGLWAGAAFVLLRESLHTQHRRSIALEGSLLEFETNLRGSREQLHEIRSTVAGAASASRLLSEGPLGAATHHRLVRAITTELGRLERLVSHRPPDDPGPVDIDATLDVLLQSHRARGRTVEWEPSGAEVLARPDDVAEALNILLDNAATHGGTTSRVAVTRARDLVEIAVSDEGPGVAAEDRDDIFGWGVHRSDSPGEGIGLSVARRLVTEHGGTLTLREASSAPGSSFIISLPAARRSEEGHVRDGRH